MAYNVFWYSDLPAAMLGPPQEAPGSKAGGTMHKQLVIGLGSGRCGSVSLQTLLNQQADTDITHEQPPFLTWQPTLTILDRKLKRICKRKAHYVGDVGSSWLPYVREVLQRFPSAKFVCLQRERSATVKSFVAKMKGEKNHWTNHDGKKWKRDRKWDPCFPKYDTGDLQEAIGLYWEDYYREVNSLCEEFPENVRSWHMEQALNSQQGVTEILSFAGFPKAAQRPQVGIILNRNRTPPRSRLHEGLRSVINVLRPGR